MENVTNQQNHFIDNSIDIQIYKNIDVSNELPHIYLFVYIYIYIYIYVYFFTSFICLYIYIFSHIDNIILLRWSDI